MRLLDLVLFKAQSELRAEASRYYLTILWWVLEPILAMGVYYLVFGLLIIRNVPDYAPFLLIGIVGWQWFERSLLHAMTAIYRGGYLMNQVSIPKVFFPAVTLTVDTIKFLITLGLLLVFLWLYGFRPSLAYLGLPLLLLSQLLLIVACGNLLAAIMPFVPDLKYLVETLLRLAFFGSGILFSAQMVPERFQFVLDVNPMAILVSGYRAILMHGTAPDWTAVASVAVLSAFGIIGSVRLIRRFEQDYPRLLAR